MTTMYVAITPPRLYIYMRFRKSLLEEQIDVFLEWGRRSNMVSPSCKEWLDRFADHIRKKDIMDVTQEDVDIFAERVYTEYQSSHHRRQALRSVQSIIRFYMARGKTVKSKRGPGRPHQIDRIEEAQTLHRANPGLSLSQIGLLMNPERPVDKSTIHRWLGLSLKTLKELSTGGK